MRSGIVLLLAALLAGVGWAEASPADGKTYTLSFTNTPGTERQYTCGLHIEVQYEQLINGSCSGNYWAGDSWTARESVLANENGKATLRFWVPEGTHGMKMPGKTVFVPLPDDIEPAAEKAHPYSLTYTRTVSGMPGEVTVLGGKLPEEQLATPYGPFYAQLFPFAFDLKVPGTPLIEGAQWSETVPVAFFPAAQNGPVAKLTRTFTFMGPQTLDGKQYLVITADIGSGDVVYKLNGKADKKKIKMNGTFTLSGKSTIYFDAEAGEIYRVTIEGACTSQVTVSTTNKKEGFAYEKTTAKFTGSMSRVAVGTTAK